MKLIIGSQIGNDEVAVQYVRKEIRQRCAVHGDIVVVLISGSENNQFAMAGGTQHTRPAGNILFVAVFIGNSGRNGSLTEGPDALS